MATKQTFAIWAPTQPDPQVQSRRNDVRPAHLKNMGRLVKEGIFKLGGPISDPETDEANGSMMIFELESVDAVWAELAKDPYWTGNVWDKERIEIKTINLSIVGDLAAGQSKA